MAEDLFTSRKMKATEKVNREPQKVLHLKDQFYFLAENATKQIPTTESRGEEKKKKKGVPEENLQ